MPAFGVSTVSATTRLSPCPRVAGGGGHVGALFVRFAGRASAGTVGTSTGRHSPRPLIRRGLLVEGEFKRLPAKEVHRRGLALPYALQLRGDPNTPHNGDDMGRLLIPVNQG